MQTPGYEYQPAFALRCEAEGKAEREVKAARAMLLELLADRELVLSEDQRRGVASRDDADVLHRWFLRTLRATFVTDSLRA